MAINKIKTGSINDSAVTTDKIQDSAVTNAKVSPSAAIAQSKVSGLTTSISNLCSSISSVSSSIGQQANNIGLLGFKMAVNDGLTVFNLVDGVVDEFNDESGTDEAEGSNDLYCATSDYYINSNSPDGIPIGPTCYSAGFSMTAITEPDTSTAGTNPAYGLGSNGTFTVPNGMTSVTLSVFGSGGGSGFAHSPHHSASKGGGGGFVSGTLAVTPGQTLYASAGEGGSKGGGPGGGPVCWSPVPNPYDGRSYGGGGRSGGGSGGGAALIATVDVPSSRDSDLSPLAPQIVLVAGSGGGGAYCAGTNFGGLGGGQIGSRGNSTTFTQATAGQQGGGGGQSSGGQASGGGQNGAFLTGGHGSSGAGGGSGYYGGAGSGYTGSEPGHGAGGGGSSYYGNPQITSGSTEAAPDGGPTSQSGGTGSPFYPSIGYSAGLGGPCTPTSGCGKSPGADGYVLLTGSASITASATSTTIVSSSFTSNTVATSARIVVFEENVDTPTLNTDVIASISRDGTNFTNATLSDSGYVTGSSGQRILTGQADISGQPSGQSMRWKLALANNTVKIHGVALQWS